MNLDIKPELLTKEFLENHATDFPSADETYAYVRDDEGKIYVASGHPDIFRVFPEAKIKRVDEGRFVILRRRTGDLSINIEQGSSDSRSRGEEIPPIEETEKTGESFREITKNDKTRITILPAVRG